MWPSPVGRNRLRERQVVLGLESACTVGEESPLHSAAQTNVWLENKVDENINASYRDDTKDLPSGLVGASHLESPGGVTWWSHLGTPNFPGADRQGGGTWAHHLFDLQTVGVPIYFSRCICRRI
jgi:hypothetical protein